VVTSGKCQELACESGRAYRRNACALQKWVGASSLRPAGLQTKPTGRPRVSEPAFARTSLQPPPRTQNGVCMPANATRGPLGKEDMKDAIAEKKEMDVPLAPS
jgi:hypothetical protein